MNVPLLPPGQALTAKFPVVGEKSPSSGAFDLKSWRLIVDGLVERRLELDLAEVLAWANHERTVDIHCVTGWSHLGMSLGGRALADLLARAGLRPEARFVSFEAYSERRHDTSLPLDLALADTWLVHSRGGRPLELEHGFPLRTVTPSRYFYKSLKWLHRIEVLAADRKGFWERESSYHNVGDPWPGDQRFTTGSLKPVQVERFRAADDFRPWRGKVLLGLDLRGWQPLSRELRGLELKNCDLRGVDLRGADLRAANLSLSDLRDADLEGADLRDSDLEGVNFAGANLKNADLSGSALSATRFFEDGQDGRTMALVGGMRFAATNGLLEDQEAFLLAAS